MADEIRIGKVSTVDYENGMIAVVYTDKESAVTKNLPVLSFNGEYKMPEREQMVLVAHLSNGSEAAIVLGTYWNKTNKPPVSGQGVYRKDFGTAAGEAYEQYSGGTLEIKADSVAFTYSGGATTIADIISRITSLESRVSSLEARI